MKTVSYFPQEYEIPSFTKLLICENQQALQEWDFSSTNKATKVETTKVPYRLEPFMINTPEKWHGWIKKEWLVISCLRTPVYLTGNQDAPP